MDAAKQDISGLDVTLHTYWQQGFENAPYVVDVCIQRMLDVHLKSFVRLHDAGSLSEFQAVTGLSDERFGQIPSPHLSDLIRTWLLIKSGGVWADPTVYFNQSLAEWIPELLDPSGIFLFHRPGRDREIANWFIAAKPKHPILVSLFERLCEYWGLVKFRNVQRPNSPLEKQTFRIVNRNIWAPRIWTWPSVIRASRLFPYMIYHYTFYDVIQSDKRLRKLWEKTPKVSALGPISLQREGLTNPLTERAKSLLDEPVAPVYKLSWKIPEITNPEGTLLDELRRRVRA